MHRDETSLSVAVRKRTARRGANGERDTSGVAAGAAGANAAEVTQGSGGCPGGVSFSSASTVFTAECGTERDAGPPVVEVSSSRTT